MEAKKELIQNVAYFCVASMSSKITSKMSQSKLARACAFILAGVLIFMARD
jgi:hypothetical protein